MKTLLVICHPRPDSMIRAAAKRTLEGLEASGQQVRILDLDEMDFDPRLTLAERRNHRGSPETRPYLNEHFEALRWCQRLILVYPTWVGSFPARLKGWIDRVWMNGVAYDLPEETNQIRGKLRNIKEIHLVTSHGSPRWLNASQGRTSKRLASRTLRVLCHPLCRVKMTTIYGVDSKSPDEIEIWLDEIQATFEAK